MKNQKENTEKQEIFKPFIEDNSFHDPKDIDTPKPDGEVSTSNEEGEDNEKPGENIFK